MTNSKSTKRALLSSAFAILICVAMLIGTTFAWFTDTASTAVNKIQAGNLKIALEKATTFETKYRTMYQEDADGNVVEKPNYNEPYIEFGGWENAKNSPLNFIRSDAEGNYSVINDNNILWEPGCTFVLQPIRVRNDGNLALKYEVRINGGSGDLELLKAIKFDAHVIYDSVQDDAIFENVISTGIICGGNLKEKDDTATIHITAHMDKNAGNEYQGKTLNGISITVVATQYTYENDSYDDQYDKNAQYPDVSYAQVSNQTEFNNALTNPTDANGDFTKKVAVVMPANSTFTLDNGIANDQQSAIVKNRRNVTFIGDGSQTVDVITNATTAEGGELNYQRGSSFTFENLTIKAGEGDFDGIVCDELTFKNCTINGKLTLYGKATFIDCTFENDMANQYSVWTWGGTDVTFEYCTFNTNGKAILLYGRATAANPTNLVVNRCIFNDRTNGAAGKAAIEIGNDYNATYTLTIIDATVAGFADGKNTNDARWANKNNMDAEHLTVIIDGEKVQ